MPGDDKMKKLRSEAPESFDFSVKVFQGLTHSFNSPTMKKAKNFTPNANLGLLKNTKENLDLWENFKKTTSVLNPYNMVKSYDRVYVMFNNIKMFENAKIFKEKFVG